MNKNNPFVKFTYFYYKNLQAIKYDLEEIKDFFDENLLFSLLQFIANVIFFIFRVIFIVLPIKQIFLCFMTEYICCDLSSGEKRKKQLTDIIQKTV